MVNIYKIVNYLTIKKKRLKIMRLYTIPHPNNNHETSFYPTTTDHKYD